VSKLFRFISEKVLFTSFAFALAGIIILIWQGGKKLDQHYQQKLLAEIKSSNTDFTYSIEKLFWGIKNNTIGSLEKDSELIFGLPQSIGSKQPNLFVFSDSLLFGSNIAIKINNRFYAKHNIKNNEIDIICWYPIDKIFQLYSTYSGIKCSIETENNIAAAQSILSPKRKFFLAKLNSIDDSESVYIATPELYSFKALSYYIIFILSLLYAASLAFLLYGKQLYRREQQATDNLAPLLDGANLLDLVYMPQALQSMSKGIRIIDKNFRVIFENKKFKEITGNKGSRTEAQFCYEYFGSIYCHTSECPISGILNGETDIYHEESRFLSNGKKIVISLHAYPLFDRFGNIIAIAEEIEDNSATHANEEIIRQTQNQFTVFFDSLPFGVYIEDGITHNILFQNFYLKNLTNNQNIKELINQQQTENKTYINEEAEILLFDNKGNRKYMLHQRFKFLGVNNQLKIGGILHDITRKKEIEHYRDVLSKAIEFTPVSIVILSPYNEFEYINPNFTELTGLTIDELYSKSILDINLEANSEGNLTKALDQVKSGKHWQGEIQLISKEGTIIWGRASFSPVFNQNSNLQHILLIIENITRWKEYEKEILLAKAKAEESDRLKTSFLNNLSHEIRTPLNAIIGFTSLLADNSISAQERTGFYEMIYSNSNELLRLIENLIEISQIETGQISIKKTEFSVNALLNEIFLEFEELEKGNSKIKLSLRKEIGHDDLVILSDYGRLKEVIKHLLSNAFKFTPNGFVEFGYRLKDEKNMMFYVVDSGIGISPDKIEYIFNPFRQADDSSTRKHGGLGLGLAISKHIVEKLGGEIWINSTPNSGTSVFFTIPFVPINMKFDNTYVGNGIKKYNWLGKTILIADDVAANFIYFKAALHKTQVKLLWARNGKEALKFIESEENINLVLMDLVMPEMDGFEATHIIKNINQNLPVVGQTAYPEQVSHIKLQEFGFNSVLEKPIRTQQMLLEIDKYLKN